MRKALRLLAATILSTAAVAAHAVTISVAQVGPLSPSGLGDSLYLNARSTVFNVPSVQMQDGTLQTTTLPGGVTSNFNFSFADTVTIQSITHMITIQGTGAIGSGPETITFLPTGPIAFGDLLLSVTAPTFTGTGLIPIALTGTITAAPPPSAVPEPSSIALLGTGILGLAGAARRKFLSA